ncbi:MAG: MscL family protein [Candidatus Bathyarchaeia archaeon]
MPKDDEMLEELRQIRKLLEPKPSPPSPPPPKGLWAEFIDFISKYKVMGLAVAFILGLYLGNLVQALVNDLIMPIISLATPNVEWEVIQLGPFRIGHFIGSLITFLIVAFVIFMLVKMTKKWGIE